MAFIEKKDPVILNIKLTSKGRELLSTGMLNFKSYAIGDSEIDYRFNSEIEEVDSEYTTLKSSILQPADNNPDLLSFITRIDNGDTHNELNAIPISTYTVENNVESIGFFSGSGSSKTFLTDSNHMRQPDAMVDLGDVNGSKKLTLLKSPSYGSSTEEPQVGDLLLIRWTHNTPTVGYNVNEAHPTPNLMYRIESIDSGKLSDNNLIVNVDRKLPELSGYSGVNAGVFVYYNQINYSRDGVMNMTPTEYLSESVLSFIENSQCPTIIYPFWNMTIIFTEEILGVQDGDLRFTQFKSRSFGGFVSYIQNQVSIYKKLGVIHYTNSSPANVYAEGFLRDTARLEIPTIMWHKSSTPTLGATFVPSGDSKLLIGAKKSLNLKYRDLHDENNPSVIVGKVFNDLKIFVIEDQELLFAMSYKSNRNWTLPKLSVVSETSGGDCPTCALMVRIMQTQPTTANSNGSIKFVLESVTSDDSTVIAILTDNNGKTYTKTSIHGDDIVFNLPIGQYTGTIYDNGAADCYRDVNFEVKYIPTTCGLRTYHETFSRPSTANGYGELLVNTPSVTLQNANITVTITGANNFNISETKHHAENFIFDLKAGTYNVKVTDDSAPNCVEEFTYEMPAYVPITPSCGLVYHTEIFKYPKFSGDTGDVFVFIDACTLPTSILTATITGNNYNETQTSAGLNNFLFESLPAGTYSGVVSDNATTNCTKYFTLVMPEYSPDAVSPEITSYLPSGFDVDRLSWKLSDDSDCEGDWNITYEGIGHAGTLNDINTTGITRHIGSGVENPWTGHILYNGWYSKITITLQRLNPLSPIVTYTIEDASGIKVGDGDNSGGGGHPDAGGQGPTPTPPDLFHDIPRAIKGNNSSAEADKCKLLDEQDNTYNLLLNEFLYILKDDMTRTNNNLVDVPPIQLYFKDGAEYKYANLVQYGSGGVKYIMSYNIGGETNYSSWKLWSVDPVTGTIVSQDTSC